MKLVTIGFSHYCEKARWALDRMGVKYTEEAHAPIGHLLAVRSAGGRKTVPILVTDDGVFDDSTDILKYIDPFGSETARLYPEAAAARRDVEDLETLFDEQLGGKVRRWVYAWIIDQPQIVKPLFEGSMSKGERRFAKAIVPLATLGIRKGMAITPRLRESNFEKIRDLFTSLDDRLKGASYLCGPTFTAADLTLASLAAPALLPDENGWPLPPLSGMPAGMQKQIGALRATQAGAHAMRMYREERKRVFTR